MSFDTVETVDGDATRLPPEPVVDGGDVELLVAERLLNPFDGDGLRVSTKQLGRWECNKCGWLNELVGDLADRLNPPDACVECERKTTFTHTGGIGRDALTAAERADRMWHPPSTYDDTRQDELWDDVQCYLYDHWDATEAEVYDGLTAWALSTWVRENLTFVPHLMLMGKTTGGKTRLLNTLSRVSYRAHLTASATPASMFRLIDAYHVSYLVSEYHGLPYDTQRELDAVVRAGQKRGEHVDRATQTIQGFEPDTFDPFTHVAIATQFEPDDDIINRCIQVRSSPENREMPATHDDEWACDIRNRLLAARFRLLDSDAWDDAEAAAYDYLAERNITGRTREKLLSLLTVAELWDRLEDGTLDRFVERVCRQDRAAAKDSEDALVVEVLRDMAFEAVSSADHTVGDPMSNVKVLLSEIAEEYEARHGVEKSPTWVGHVRSRLDLGKERTRDGTVIQDVDLGEKLRELCDEMNLEWESADSYPGEEVIPDYDEEDAADDTDGTGGFPTTGLGAFADGNGESDDSQQALHDAIMAGFDDDGTPVMRETLEAFTCQQGFDHDRVEHHIDRMLEEGALLENGNGELQVTGGVNL